MKIYISIPISGYNPAIQKAEAAEIAELIRARGHTPVNPFDTPEPPEELNEEERYAYFIGEDIKRLLLCDAIYLCKGWKNSTGCLIELNAAYTTKKIKIIGKYQLERL